MKIEFIPIDLIDEYENNSNTHPEEQLHQIEALITEFGYTTPALVQKNDDRFNLIAGHGRREVVNSMHNRGHLLRMADGTAIPKGTLPVQFADGWSENQVRAHVHADNQVSRNSVVDMDIVATEIKILEDADYDIELLGFDFSLDDDGIIPDEIDFPEMADGDREPFQQKTFTLHDEQIAIIDDAIMQNHNTIT